MSLIPRKVAFPRLAVGCIWVTMLQDTGTERDLLVAPGDMFNCLPLEVADGHVRGVPVRLDGGLRLAGVGLFPTLDATKEGTPVQERHRLLAVWVLRPGAWRLCAFAVGKPFCGLSITGTWSLMNSGLGLH